MTKEATIKAAKAAAEQNRPAPPKPPAPQPYQLREVAQAAFNKASKK